MKKLFLASIVLMTFALVTHADIIYPDGSTPEGEPYQLQKIGRGIAALALAPFELPRAIFDITFEKGAIATEGLAIGIPRGLTNSFRRFANGVYDVFYWGEGDRRSLLHLEPEVLNIFDAIPTLSHQFDWSTIDTTGGWADTMIY